jgi:hypothetical protein
MHTDDSDITLNVCLGTEFEASGLTFCGDFGAPDHRAASFQYQHIRGRGLLHLGRRRHGADDIQSGHRMNLIMWNHNRDYRATPAYRTQPYYKESGSPDPVCISFTHDRDYEAIVGEERPEGSAKFAQTAWCPYARETAKLAPHPSSCTARIPLPGFPLMLDLYLTADHAHEWQATSGRVHRLRR